MRMLRLLTLAVVALTLTTAATVVPVGEFRAIEVRNGGHVVVRHGAAQRVSVIEGDPRCAEIRLGGGGRLIIDNAGHCSHDRRLRVEVVTPHLSGVSVSNGGSLQTAGTFPAQPSIAAAVEQGGTIDIRSIAADDVDASVYSGGRIFTTSRKSLAASVRHGGAITYWGNPADVRKSVRNGGVVTRGAAEDAETAVSE